MFKLDFLENEGFNKQILFFFQLIFSYRITSYFVYTIHYKTFCRDIDHWSFLGNGDLIRVFVRALIIMELIIWSWLDPTSSMTNLKDFKKILSITRSVRWVLSSCWEERGHEGFTTKSCHISRKSFQHDNEYQYMCDPNLLLTHDSVVN